jgi:YihY family inner membrane protein
MRKRGGGRATAITMQSRVVRFLRAVVRRYWDADGPSHTRGLAYHSTLVLLAGFIGFIGMASVFDAPAIRGTAEQMITRLSPGPSGRILQQAARQGAAGGAAAMVLGFGTALAAGTRGMRQVERAANRMFGVERDRPFLDRYRVAFLLALSAGTLLAAGGLALAGGQAIAEGAGFRGTAGTVWSVARWPLGASVAAAAVFLVYRIAPRRHPDTRRALVWGAASALVLWLMFTGLLVLYFSVSEKATSTYGPLVGIVALLLWSAFSSLALNLGLAVTAELAGVTGSQRRAHA